MVIKKDKEKSVTWICEHCNHTMLKHPACCILRCPVCQKIWTIRNDDVKEESHGKF